MKRCVVHIINHVMGKVEAIICKINYWSNIIEAMWNVVKVVTIPWEIWWDVFRGWSELVTTLTGVARRHPQTTYVVLQKSLQQEWAFVQRVTPDIGIYFQAVEYKLRYTFLPALFQGDTSQIHGRAITCLPVKQSNRLGLNSLTQLGHQGWTGHCPASSRGTFLRRTGRTAKFRSVNYAFLMVRGGRISNGDMQRQQRPPWERPRTPYPSHTPDGWWWFSRRGRGCRWSPQIPMGWN